MPSTPRRAFTIIELLVVVSVIGLLIGLLLPAIGKARDQARLTQSQGNLRNLGSAHEVYGSEWNGRQFTLIVDGMSQYGNRPDFALEEYIDSLGGNCGFTNKAGCHPGPMLGWAEVDGTLILHEFPIYPEPPFNTNLSLVQPIVFTDAGGMVPYFGSFRLGNVRQFNQYVGGRFYDPTFYAPKDTAVLAAIGDCLDDPGEFCFTGNQQETYFTSYVLSPAAMFSPEVLSLNPETDEYYHDPWDLKGGFRSPSIGQCAYPGLKTRMLEHHWLQNPRGDCNPGMTRGTYDGCEPYYFNHGWESVPVTLFYDGHIEGLGTREASQDNLRVVAQTGGHGLWSTDTPFGGRYEDGSDGGYFMDRGYDWTATSYHVLTLEGIKGRDKLDK